MAEEEIQQDTTENAEEKEEEEIPQVSLDYASMKYVTEPKIRTNIKNLIEIAIERELRTSNITTVDGARLNDKLKMVDDCIELGLIKRAEKIINGVLSELGLSKSVDGWQQRLFRTQQQLRETRNIPIQEPKKKGMLSGFFGSE